MYQFVRMSCKLKLDEAEEYMCINIIRRYSVTAILLTASVILCRSIEFQSMESIQCPVVAFNI